MKRLALIGSKDFAKQVIELATESKQYSIFGYFEDFEPKGTIINGYQVYGTVDDAIRLYKEGAFDCIFIALGYNHFDVKEKFYNRVKGVIPLANIIASDVDIAKSAKLGEGIFLGKGCKIGAECELNDNVVLMGDIILGHNNTIGRHSYMSGGNHIAGFSSVGERCFMGIRVIIGDHIRVTSDVWMGLGMIVFRNILKPGKYAVLQKIVNIE